MAHLNSLLIMQPTKSWMEYLPLGVAIACGLLLLAAFLIGYFKGFRRVSWFGLVWGGIGGSYFLLEKLLGEKNPVRSLLSRMSLDGSAVRFLSSFALLAGCILVVFIAFGICSIVFRPSIKRKFKEGSYLDREDGIEYDDYAEDYEDYNETQVVYIRKGYRKPSIFARIIGGFICAINVATILFAFGGVAFLGINSVPLLKSKFDIIYTNPKIIKLFPYLLHYVFDFVFIGIITLTIYKGYKKGTAEGARKLIINLSRLIAITLSFGLPFFQSTKVGGTEVILKLTDKSVQLLQGVISNELISKIGGRLLLGCVLCIISIIIIELINCILKKIVDFIWESKLLKTVDKIVSCFVFAIVGTLICIAVWAVLFLLQRYTSLSLSTMFSDHAKISHGLIESFKIYLQPYVDDFLRVLKNLKP